MSAWALVAPLALALLALLAAGRWRRALPVAAALAAGLGGYAALGRPALPASPAAIQPGDPLARPAIERERGRLLANYGDIAGWLALADAFAKAGRTADAVETMRTALRAFPDSPDLWVGLGNHLVLHSEGQVVPAARLAFGRANSVDPKHPAPRYFLGLALLQAARPAEARRVWEDLRRDSPADAAWLPDLNRKIAATRSMELLGVGRDPAGSR